MVNCAECLHSSVCPSAVRGTREHCNDYLTPDDLVVHAKWIWKEEERPQLCANPKFLDIVKHSFKYPYAPEKMWHCSHCGKPPLEPIKKILTLGDRRLIGEEYKPPICPLCGAKMDLKD